ncbi:MAG: alpha/beta fold hydrolase [Caldilineales bacterium]
MDTTELLARWSTMSLEEIEAELQAGKDQASAEQLLGSDQVNEIQEVETRRAPAGPREAVVLLPGLMGSLLTSIRGVTSLLWINPLLILEGKSNYLELNRDGTSDGSPMVHAAPLSLEKMTYLKMAVALRRECLLFEFPYDWRLRIETNAEYLAAAIETWADGDSSLQFTLVGHSMGGLVARALVNGDRSRARKRIKRVITLGTPHFGASGAVSDIMLGNRMMAIASALNDNNDMRRMLSTFPSVFQLLPAPPDLFPRDRHYPVNFDVYDEQAWRMDSIRQDYLDGGKRLHELLAGDNHPVPTVQIAGCHLDTIIDVEREFDGTGRSKLNIIREKTGADSGDATVPLWSARLPGADMYYVQEIHRDLPKNKEVIDAVIDLIYGRIPDLPDTLPEPKGGFLGFRPVTGSPEMEAEKLRQRIEAGTATEEDLQLLFFING